MRISGRRTIAALLTVAAIPAAVSLTATTAHATITVEAAPAAASTTDKVIRVVQHNTDQGGTAAALRVARNLGDIDAITLQEVCESQANRLRGQGWKVRWVPMRHVDSCPAVTHDQGTRRTKGVAVVTRHRIVGRAVQDLNSYGGRDFKLLCVELAGTGVAKTWICTTHLSLSYADAPDGIANRTAQIALIKQKIDKWVGWGRRVVLTGDLNNAPPEAKRADRAVLEPLYRLSGVSADPFDSDLWWEGDQNDTRPVVCDGRSLCRTIEPTTDKGQRIDYFFASHRGVNPRKGIAKRVYPVTRKVGDRDVHGHHVIFGRVTFRDL